MDLIGKRSNRRKNALNNIRRVLKNIKTTDNNSKFKCHKNRAYQCKWDYCKKYKMIQFIQEAKPDVVTIIETHLKGNDELQINGYEWVGENFSGAIRGSRGVGFLIKMASIIK